jgi:hypothetical protein
MAEEIEHTNHWFHISFMPYALANGAYKGNLRNSDFPFSCLFPLLEAV